MLSNIQSTVFARHDHKSETLPELIDSVQLRFKTQLNYADYYALIYYPVQDENNAFQYAYECVESFTTVTKQAYEKTIIMFILVSGIKKQPLFIPDYFKALQKVYEKEPSTLIDYAYRQDIFDKESHKDLTKAILNTPIQHTLSQQDFESKIQHYDKYILFNQAYKYLDARIGTAILYDHNLNEITKVTIPLECIDWDPFQVTTVISSPKSKYRIQLQSFYLNANFNGFGSFIKITTDKPYINFEGYLVLPCNPLPIAQTQFMQYFETQLETQPKNMQVISNLIFHNKYLIALKLKQ